ncbi:MAG: NmrA/HSCARG family protein [Cyclobacteriaceae bacterium]
MSDKKNIAITGATGAQGGGLAHAILDDASSEFSVRAITRDVNSDKAKALADKGAEVVAGDVNDASSIQSAFEGAYGAFCVTFFWEHFSPETEMQHAKMMADAAKAAGLEHVVWSTLEDTRKWVSLDDDSMPTLNEKYKVPHFDGKGESNAYFLESGVPVTLLHTSFYWDNLIYFGMGPQKGPDGNLTFNLPMGDKKLPGIAAEDIGKCAYGVFKGGSKYFGEFVGIAGEHLTGEEMAATLSKVLDHQIGYFAVPFDMYRGLGFDGAEDLGNMFQVKHDYNEQFCGLRDVGASKAMNADLLSFEQWVEKYKEKLQLEA